MGRTFAKRRSFSFVIQYMEKIFFFLRSQFSVLSDRKRAERDIQNADAL